MYITYTYVYIYIIIYIYTSVDLCISMHRACGPDHAETPQLCAISVVCAWCFVLCFVSCLVRESDLFGKLTCLGSCPAWEADLPGKRFSCALWDNDDNDDDDNDDAHSQERIVFTLQFVCNKPN